MIRRLFTVAVLVGLGAHATAAQAACEGLSGMELARCSLAQQPSPNPFTPGGAGSRPSVAPQFDPSTSLPTTLYDRSGSLGADRLTQEGSAALEQNELTPFLLQTRQDAKAWHLDGSPALATAESALASAIQIPGVGRQCETQDVCVARGEPGLETVTCHEPASELHLCSEGTAVVTIVSPAEFQPVENGAHNPIGGFCDYHWHDQSDRFGLSGSCYILKIPAYDTTVLPWRFQLCAKAWYRYKGEVFPITESCVWVNEGEPFSEVLVQPYAAAGSDCCATTRFEVTASGRIANGFGEVTFTPGAGSSLPHEQTLGFTYVPPDYSIEMQDENGQPAAPCSIPEEALAACRQPEQTCTGTSETRLVDGVAVEVPCTAQANYIQCRMDDTCAPYRARQGCATSAILCGQADRDGRCLWYETTMQCQTAGSCVEVKPVTQCSQCGEPDSLIPFCLDSSTPANPNFALAAGYLELAQQLRREYDPTSQTVFKGDVRRCRYNTQLEQALSSGSQGITSAAIAGGMAAFTGGAGAVIALSAMSAAGSGALQGYNATAVNCCSLNVQSGLSTSYMATNALYLGSKYSIQYYQDQIETAEHAIQTAMDAVVRANEVRTGTQITAEAIVQTGQPAIAEGVRQSAEQGGQWIAQGNDWLAGAQQQFDLGNYKEATEYAHKAVENVSDAVEGMNSALGSADQSLGSLADADWAAIAADLGGTIATAAVGMGLQYANAQLMGSIFGGSCDSDDLLLALERKAGLSVYVGTRCVSRIDLGFSTLCRKKEEVWCSFKSILARLIQQQGRQQTGRSFGAVNDGMDAPDCGGFTIAEFSQMHFEQMNLQEFYDHLKPRINESGLQYIGTRQAERFVNRQGGGGSP